MLNLFTIRMHLGWLRTKMANTQSGLYVTDRAIWRARIELAEKYEVRALKR